jgi:hypothetical protein
MSALSFVAMKVGDVSSGFHKFEQRALKLKPIRQRSHHGFRYGSARVPVPTQFDGQPSDGASNSSIGSKGFARLRLEP